MAKRCKYCKRKKAVEEYDPYCSFHCQEWGKLIEARKHLRMLKDKEHENDSGISP